MNKFNLSGPVLVVLLLMTSGLTSAQDLSESLSSVASEYASFYVRPLTDALGADYNSGLFHSADNGPRNGFHLYVGLKVFATQIESSDERFSTTYSGHYTFEEAVAGQLIKVTAPAVFTVRDASTIFGDETLGTITVRSSLDTTITIGGQPHVIRFDSTFSMDPIEPLIDLPAMPAGAPQLEIGTILGTDVMIRYVPSFSDDEVGRFGLFGAGIRHSLSQYLPRLPFHLAIQGVWQNLFLDDNDGEAVFDLTTWAVNIQASKKIGMLTFYGGLQAEDASIEITYTLENEDIVEIGDPGGIGTGDPFDPVDISLDLDGANSFRGIAGLSLQAGPIHIASDINFGKVRSASASIGLSF